MQTLLDPFELAFPPPPVSVRVAPPLEPIVVVDAEAERESAPAPAPSLPPNPDSSGRLRCWCSDDY